MANRKGKKEQQRQKSKEPRNPTKKTKSHITRKRKLQLPLGYPWGGLGGEKGQRKGRPSKKKRV